MPNWSQVKTWLLSLLLVAVTYVVATDLLSNLLLLAVNSGGYLPYSDRPGPGWQRPHLPSRDELQFFFGFSLFMLKGSASYGSLFALLACLLGFCNLPRWTLRLVATPLALLSAGVFMAAAGWAIALSSLGVYIAAGCGGLWGLLVFPHLVPKATSTPALAIRIVAPLLIFAAGGYWLIRPLLPDRGLTNGRVEVIRRAATLEAPLSFAFLGSGFAAALKETDHYVSVSRLQFTTDGKNQVRALLIVDDPEPVAHTFLLPRTGLAVYRQSHGVWKEERESGRISDISVTLTAFNSTLQIQGPCCSSMASGFAPYR